MRTHADVLEQSEHQAWELMNRWNPAITIPTISYNRNFAVLDLQQSVATLIDLSGFNPENEEYQHEVSKTAVVLLNRLRQLSQEKQEEITDIINETKVKSATADVDKINIE